MFDISLFRQKKLYDEDFINEIQSEEDWEILEEKVRELKRQRNSKPTIIKLKNGKVFTIVVMSK